MVVGQEAEVADADKARRQNVEEKAAEELGRGELEHFDLGSIRVVTPTQMGDAVAQREESIVRERDAMRVAAEILDHGAWTLKGWLRVHHPGSALQHVHREMELGWKLGSGIAQPFEKLGPKDLRQRSNRKEKSPACAHEARLVGRERASRDDAVQMEMRG